MTMRKNIYQDFSYHFTELNIMLPGSVCVMHEQPTSEGLGLLGHI